MFTLSAIEKKELDQIFEYLKFNKISDNLKGLNKKRFITKANKFKIIDDILYLRSNSNNHKKVILSSKKTKAKMEVKILYISNHFGVNKLEKLGNQYFFLKYREKLCEKLLTLA